MSCSTRFQLIYKNWSRTLPLWFAVGLRSVLLTSETLLVTNSIPLRRSYGQIAPRGRSDAAPEPYRYCTHTPHPPLRSCASFQHWSRPRGRWLGATQPYSAATAVARRPLGARPTSAQKPPAARAAPAARRRRRAASPVARAMLMDRASCARPWLPSAAARSAPTASRVGHLRRVRRPRRQPASTPVMHRHGPAVHDGALGQRHIASPSAPALVGAHNEDHHVHSPAGAAHGAAQPTTRPVVHRRGPALP